MKHYKRGNINYIHICIHLMAVSLPLVQQVSEQHDNVHVEILRS